MTRLKEFLGLALFAIAMLVLFYLDGRIEQW